MTHDEAIDIIRQKIERGGKLSPGTMRDEYGNTFDPEKRDLANALEVAVEALDCMARGELLESTAQQALTAIASILREG